MRQSELFTKTKKEVPSDEISKNAELLSRGGFVHKELSGVYTYLPLGLRVLKKIEKIIREEMDAIGGQEVELSVLQNPEIWEKSGRWGDQTVDNWFKTKLKGGSQVGLGFTHEEPLTSLLTNFVSSYRDLPLAIYQIQTKFRNELRAKSGLLRGREFLMKDMYSFHADPEDFRLFYEKVKTAYKNIWERVGIGHLTYLTFASGGIFSEYSHEFQTVTPAGEDTIYVSEEKAIAVNKEVLNDEVLAQLGLKREKLSESRGIEVGNIFDLKTRFSEVIGLYFTDERGERRPVVMGSYGIGLPRLMGTVVEVLSDDKGIIWPESIAPFKLHLLALSNGGAKVGEFAEEVYERISLSGVEVLFDDRDLSAGEKFADADLLGMPYRGVVSERSVAEGGVELKKRIEERGEIVALPQLIKLLK